MLIYYDGVFHAVGQLEVVKATCRQLQAEYRDQWRRMWLYDRPSRTALP